MIKILKKKKPKNKIKTLTLGSKVVNGIWAIKGVLLIGQLLEAHKFLIWNMFGGIFGHWKVTNKIMVIGGRVDVSKAWIAMKNPKTLFRDWKNALEI